MVTLGFEAFFVRFLPFACRFSGEDCLSVTFFTALGAAVGIFSTDCFASGCTAGCAADCIAVADFVFVAFVFAAFFR